ncbi:MAG: ubiquinol-cytochrome c reductase iron-sulfur subunit [Prochlorotrichaceae cyanobacterium]
MERRQFLTWMGLGFLVTASPATIASCQSSEVTTPTAETVPPLDVPPPPEELGAVTNASEGYVIGSVADLDEQGILSGKPDFADATVHVIRDPQAPDTLYALNATCPHQQCEVDWKGDQAQFVCPCHQGKFAPDGTVLAAPPTSDLVAYRASIEGDQVLVSPS